jgi:hypothetical protein
MAQVNPQVERLFRSAGRDPLDFYQFDSLIFKYTCKFGINPVIFKGHVARESSCIDGSTREEKDFRRRYATGLKRVVNEMRAYSLKHYGVTLSRLTIESQLVTSWGPGQIMGVKAWEQGWRGYSMAAASNGLANNDTSLYYACKLYRENMKRYPNEPMKFIIAYNRGSYSPAGMEYYNYIMQWAALAKHDFDKYKCR